MAQLSHNGSQFSSKEAQSSHKGVSYSSEEAQLSSKEAQLSKDSSKFSSYEAYVLPNYGVSVSKHVYGVLASVNIGYKALSNHIGIPKIIVVSLDLKAENTHETFHLIG